MFVQPATTALDAATIVGILLCVLKGTDLLLRPHQEAALKRYLESFTLWLSYANPLAYYRRIVNRRVLGVLGLLVLVVFSPLYRVVVVRFMTLKSDEDALPMLTGVLAGFVSLWVVHKNHKFMIEVTGGAYAEKHNLPFGLRQFLIATGEILLIVIVFSLMTGSVVLFLPNLAMEHRLDPSGGKWEYTVVGVAPFLYTIAEFGGPAVIILLACLGLLILQMLVNAGNAILWRVVEYGKGPVAAVTVVLTVILGFLDLYVHFGVKPK